MKVSIWIVLGLVLCSLGLGYWLGVAVTQRAAKIEANRLAVETHRQTYLAELSQKEAERQSFYAALSAEKAKQEKVLAEKIAEDTINYWTVLLDGQQLRAFNETMEDRTIVLTKGKIRAKQLLEIRYSNDAPCLDCLVEGIIKTTSGKIVQKVALEGEKSWKEETAPLQVLAQKNKRETLSFFYRIDQREVFLFDLRIR